MRESDSTEIENAMAAAISPDATDKEIRNLAIENSDKASRIYALTGDKSIYPKIRTIVTKNLGLEYPEPSQEQAIPFDGLRPPTRPAHVCVNGRFLKRIKPVEQLCNRHAL